MPEKLKKPIISPSQISSYTRCPEAYRRRYIEKEIIPPSISIIKGTSIHKTSEKNFIQKLETKIDLKKKDIIDLSVSTLEETIKHEGIHLNEEEKTIGKEKIIDKAKDSTVGFADKYADLIAPKYQPLEIEIEQYIELPNSTHDLKGIIDLVDTNNNIVDLKTSSKSMSQSDVDKSSQFTFYSLVRKAKTGQDHSKIIVENLVQTKETKLNTLETTRTNDDYQILINRINSVVNAINAGIFPPTHEGNWACSIKFCGYAPTCKYYSNK